MITTSNSENHLIFFNQGFNFAGEKFNKSSKLVNFLLRFFCTCRYINPIDELLLQSF